jgi:hypothetical protein
LHGKYRGILIATNRIGGSVGAVLGHLLTRTIPK